MWRSVIFQSFTDVCIGKESQRWDVIQWIKTADFNEVCESADLNAERIADFINSLNMIESKADRAALLKQIKGSTRN